MPQLEVAFFVPQLAWLLISFAALYLILARYALPRISNVLEERSDRIADDIDRAESLRRDADAAAQAYEDALQEARRKSHEVSMATRDKLRAEAERHRAELDKELAIEAQAATAQIEEASQQARAEIKKIASDTACDIAEKLLNIDAAKLPASQAVEHSFQQRGTTGGGA